MKKIIFFIIYLFILQDFVFCQSLERPVVCDDCYISSDFGARYPSSYDWHPAIDYSAPS